MNILVPFLIGLSIMLIIMLKTKLNPFYSLIFGALIIGIGCGLSPLEVVDGITEGLSKTVKSLGIVIIFGTALGDIIEKSNGTQRIATSLLSVTGNSRATIALAATGFIVSIPVFCDVALIMLAPLVIAISKNSNKTLGHLSMPLTLSLLITNSWVAPTPAPVAAATNIGLDLGVSIMWAIPVSIVLSAVAWLYSEIYLGKKPESWWGRNDNMKVVEEDSFKNLKMPSIIKSITPIVVPLLLMVGNTVLKVSFPEDSEIVKLFAFLGNKNISICIGMILAAILLKDYIPEGGIFESFGSAIDKSAGVIFITAAGGSLSKIIEITGVGTYIAEGLSSSALPVILVPFLIAGLSKFAQGSGSVAVAMSSSMTLPLITSGLIHPVVAFLSICAGSQFGSHVNNSFFWVYANEFGFDTKTTLKSLAVGQHVVAVAGLGVAWIISLFI